MLAAKTVEANPSMSPAHASISQAFITPAQMPSLAETADAFARLHAYIQAHGSADDSRDLSSNNAQRAKLQSSVDRPGEMESAQPAQVPSDRVAVRCKHNKAIGRSLHESARAANALCVGSGVVPSGLAASDLLLERRLGQASFRRQRDFRMRLESDI